MILAQQLINGIMLGSVYALVAIGLSLVWATARLLDFAYGQVFMLGGVLSWTFVAAFGWPLLPGVLAAALLCAAAGFAIQRGVYARLSGADHVIVLIATIGMSMILQDGAARLWGTETLTFPPRFDGVFTIGGLIVRSHFALIILAALCLIAALHLLITRSKLGVALRAVAENRRAAAMMGVDVVAMLGLGFGVAYFLAAVAGGLIGPIHYVATSGGTPMMVKGIAAAVLGGFGSLPGALLGGMTIGLVEALSAGYISSAFKDVIVFAVFILVLFARPQGLLGERRTGVADV